MGELPGRNVAKTGKGKNWKNRGKGHACVGAVELNKNYSGWTARSIHGNTKF